MLAQKRRVFVAKVLEQAGRAFDVGEQEGDGPCWETWRGTHNLSWRLPPRGKFGAALSSQLDRDVPVDRC